MFFYQSPNGSTIIEMLYAEENIWLTQKRIAEVYDVPIPTINEHLKNIFNEKELEEGYSGRKMNLKTNHRMLDSLI